MYNKSTDFRFEKRIALVTQSLDTDMQRLFLFNAFFYSTWPPSFSSHIKNTDMQRLFYSTWPPSFSSHIKNTDVQRLFLFNVATVVLFPY